MGQRVLYLHGLTATPATSKRQKLLEAACGPDALCTPNLYTRQTLLFFSIGYVIFAGILSLLIGLACNFLSVFLALGVTLLLIILGIVVHVIFMPFAYRYLIESATRRAETAFWSFRPNTIVASSFGAVIVFQMNVPKVALLLLAPGQDMYGFLEKAKELPTLVDYPYALLVHGSNDRVVSLDDSIRLVDSSPFAHCKLEVIDDDHELRSLTAGDFREFLDEIYQRARENIRSMDREVMRMPLRKRGSGKNVPTIDPTLFDLEQVPSQSPDAASRASPESEQPASQAVEEEVLSSKISGSSEALLPYTDEANV